MAIKSEIEAALAAHSAWRERFKDILYGRAPFDLARISAVDQCTLGKWLLNEGHRMIPSELHEEICAVHGDFHRIAADILQKIKDKRFAEAKQDIALEGPLNQTSLKLRRLLGKLSFREPEKARVPVDDEQPANSAGEEELLSPGMENGMPHGDAD